MRPIARRVRRLFAELRFGGRVLLKEISAFGVVGVINFVANLAIFNVLTEVLGWAVVRSSIIATVVTMTTSYFMNRHWSFSHRARTGLRREYTIFVAINAVALAIESAIVAGVEYGLGQDDTVSRNVAKAVGITIGTALRFWSYKRWVFLAHDTGDGADTPPTRTPVPPLPASTARELEPAEPEPVVRRAHSDARTRR